MFQESRRRLIIGAGATAAALAVSHFSSGEAYAQSSPELQPLNPDISSYPHLFSEKVKTFNLEPRILKKPMWASDVMLAGVDYLRNAAVVLDAHPEFSQRTAESMGIVGPERYPTSINSSDTMGVILNRMLEDIRTKRLVIWGGSMQNVPYLFGTVNNPKQAENGDWYVESQFHANADYPFGETQTEEPGFMYDNYTNLQVALKMLHEYGHVLQGRQLLSSTMDRYNTAIAHTPTESNVAAFMGKRDEEISIGMNNDPRINRNLVKGKISFNEIQANLLAQRLLLTLNELNGRRMPGTQDDSYPVKPDSLYQTFQRAIVTEGNHYDSTWLIKHSNWGQ